MTHLGVYWLESLQKLLGRLSKFWVLVIINLESLFGKFG